MSHYSGQIEQWRHTQLTDDRAKLILQQAFVEGKLEATRSLLLPAVHRQYFEPHYLEFSARTMWSLSRAYKKARLRRLFDDAPKSDNLLTRW